MPPSPPPAPGWTWIDPRRSLAARLGWAHGLLTLTVALAASLWLAGAQRERIEASLGQTFRQYATQISNEIDGQLHSRQQWLGAQAAIFGRLVHGGRLDPLEPVLVELRHQLPEFDWVAIARPDGRLAVSDGPIDRLRSVSGEAWFRHGLEAQWVDDLNGRRADSAERPGAGPTGNLRLAAPIRDASGHVIGVLGAQLSADWVHAFGLELTQSLRTRRSIEVLVINDAGVLLFGPSSRLGQAVPGQPDDDIAVAMRELRTLRADGALRAEAPFGGHSVQAAEDGQKYLAGWALSDGYGDFPGMGWVVWVREPTRLSFASAEAQALRLLAAIMLTGVAITVAGLWISGRATRRLAAIAASADDIRAGRRDALEPTPGRDEVARIGGSLQTLLDTVQARTRALEELNHELDGRVAARTREVERLADENRHAALMRERLRIARDLHDTLAQSLMSLLTEIRLMRRLVQSRPEALADELARAEQAARDGLREARAAITQLRHHPVRDTGLGPALEQLLWREGERSGLSLRLAIDPDLADWADSRAEIVHRLVEEALRNVIRHAHASQADVSIASTAGQPPRIEVSIRDDGIGFDPAAVDTSGHFGLQGMREWAEVLGAALHVESQAGQGTVIRLDMIR